jgi:hypothetical protein
MKKSLMLCGLLLALTASIASAAPGTNLRWLACFGDAGAANRNFACNLNTGTEALVGGFELGADLTGTTGIEIVVDVATAGSTLPAWWVFSGVGGCRVATPPILVMNPTISVSASACADWAGGAAAGGLAAYQIGTAGPNTARMIGGFAVAAANAANLTGGQEYFGFNALISHAKTVGTGACAGCNIAACIVLNSIKCATPPVAGQPSRDVTVSGPTNGTDSNFCTWQGGAGVNSGRGTGCPAATPTQKTTWQQVKSLYR